MNNRTLKKLFDAASPSQFQQERMLRVILKQKGANLSMEKTRKPKMRIAALAAALAAILVLSVSAAVLLLGPKDVAQQVGDPALAAAFDSPDAIVVNQSLESEGYRFTLAGLVSGKGLSDFAQNVDEVRTYAVASVERLDGESFDTADTELVLSPLVAGFAPNQVNAWTLGGGYNSFVQNGVVYYLFDCQNLQLFADHTVYLAAYEGFAPGPDLIHMAEDGSLSFTEQVQGPHALFTLPLDPDGADPEAAQQFLNSLGIVAR